MKRRRARHSAAPIYLSRILLTLDQLTLIKEALILFERILHSRKEPYPNRQFAEETIIVLKAKIEYVKTVQACGQMMSFDI